MSEKLIRTVQKTSDYGVTQKELISFLEVFQSKKPLMNVNKNKSWLKSI